MGGSQATHLAGPGASILVPKGELHSVWGTTGVSHRQWDAVHEGKIEDLCLDLDIEHQTTSSVDGGADATASQGVDPEVSTSEALPLLASKQGSPVRNIPLCLGLLQIFDQQGHALGIVADMTTEPLQLLRQRSYLEAHPGQSSRRRRIRLWYIASSGVGLGDRRAITGQEEDVEGGGDEKGEANFTPLADLALFGGGDIC
ncbi:hypothetical protein LIER_20845 [Lithospermum erythrorhizon]|uniref:Uncharacterized protein n=1 Tax=Lithospermum erythrorhizon TaxID=34254 RepID=A0AAV3QN20_LITER